MNGNSFEVKVNSLKAALINFEQSLKLDLANLRADYLDAIYSGQMQKFEFCLVLFWKVLKLDLWFNEKVDAPTPKMVCKFALQTNKITQEEYQIITQMIDDRNLMSHV